MNEEPVSVSELTHAIKGLLEEGIGSVVVVGEVSNYKLHTSGHRYFTLKDASSQINCTMWRSRNLSFKPEDGMRVVVSGKLSLYAAQGKYQIDCFAMQPEGVGDLYVAFEQLKRDLDERGYFDPGRKRGLPAMPQRIGIATSETGAAYHDMVTTIGRRFPHVTIVFRPTLVQGDGSARDIANAVRDLEQQIVDVIIVGRGGGSIEDLWSFNTLEVADAIYNCSVPVVSAVGHETDVTIADYVADVRAATPTAAAELVTAVTTAEIMYSLDHVTDRLTSAVGAQIEDLLDVARSFMDGRTERRLSERITARDQRIEDLQQRTRSVISLSIASLRARIDHLVSLYAALHPEAPLQRGYAIIEKNGIALAADQALSAGDEIRIRRKTEKSTAIIQTTEHTPST